MKSNLFVATAFLLYLSNSCTESNSLQKNVIEKTYHPITGIGDFDSLELKQEINLKLANTGDQLYMDKCASCHDLSTKKIVGPGWEGVTKKRHPAWLMNLMTNTEQMLEMDVELKKQIEQYKSKMPDFGLTKKEALALLEFMRQNDRNEVDRQREMPTPCKELSR